MCRQDSYCDTDTGLQHPISKGERAFLEIKILPPPQTSEKKKKHRCKQLTRHPLYLVYILQLGWLW